VLLILERRDKSRLERALLMAGAVTAGAAPLIGAEGKRLFERYHRKLLEEINRDSGDGPGED